MLYTLISTDKPGALEIRLANRDAHLAYAKASGVLKMAGPFLDDDGGMCGSLLVIDVEDRAAAEAFAENDPYKKAGLFSKTEIRAWKQVI